MSAIEAAGGCGMVIPFAAAGPPACAAGVLAFVDEEAPAEPLPDAVDAEPEPLADAAGGAPAAGGAAAVTVVVTALPMAIPATAIRSTSPRPPPPPPPITMRS